MKNGLKEQLIDLEKVVQVALSKLKKQANFWIALRLGAFLAAVLGVYFFATTFNQLWVVFSLTCIVFFLVAIKQHATISRSLVLNGVKLKIIQKELGFPNSFFQPAQSAQETTPMRHAFALDLDILAPQGLFNRIKRSFTPAGEQLILNELLSGLEHSTAILERQKHLQIVGKKVHFGIDFLTLGQLASGALSDLTPRIAYLQSMLNPLKLIQKIAFLYILPIVSLSMMMATILGFISSNQFLIYLALPFGVTAIFLKRTTAIVAALSKLQSEVWWLKQLMQLLHKEDELLVEVFGKNDAANSAVMLQQINELDAIANAFENRNNPFVGIVLNGFLLWDMWQTHRIATWVSHNTLELDHWIKRINQLEVLVSESMYVNHNATHSWPVFIESKNVIEANQLAHPFLPVDEAVTNSVEIKKDSIIVLTGANMTGKSTFLRTIGLSLIMARSGLPVFAQSFGCKFQNVFTSMRTDDSLTDHRSYFLAEISRLKELVQRLKSDENLFFLVDEIFKGTNSTDKAEGSALFLERLSALKHTGIAATHDLSVCDLAHQYPAKIFNYCFEVEVVGEEMKFDYTLKKGIAANLNAKLLIDSIFKTS